MTSPYRPLRAEIRLDHLRHNIRLLRKMASNDFFCPMVKANAYGHDDIAVSIALVDEGISHVGVALYEEGVRLRDNKVSNCEILVFNPIMNEATVEAAARYELTPVLSSWREIEFLDKSNNAPAAVHLKFNTGMNRLGFDYKDVGKLKSYFQSSDRVQLRGVCTHFFDGEDYLLSEGSTQRQIRKFKDIAKTFSGKGVVAHALNSSALVASYCKALPSEFGARPGLAIYGLKPHVLVQSDAQKDIYNHLEFKPVMKIVAQIVHQHLLKIGESVSYGARFVAEKATTIGVVPIGYADGYPRLLSSRSAMLCNGRKAQVSGTVCMDFTMINLTQIAAPPSGWVGQEVVVLGETTSGAVITAEELAELVGTNTYEIVTNVSRRVPRVVS